MFAFQRAAAANAAVMAGPGPAIAIVRDEMAGSGPAMTTQRTETTRRPGTMERIGVNR
jgi:hypothetical protein